MWKGLSVTGEPEESPHPNSLIQPKLQLDGRNVVGSIVALHASYSSIVLKISQTNGKHGVVRIF